MARVLMPPSLPLPNVDDRLKKETKAKARARARGEQVEQQAVVPKYNVGTMIGTVAAAAAGEGSSNELHAAAYHGLIDELIRVEKGPDTLSKANARDSLGRTPLMTAVLQGFTHCVEVLISLGADPNYEDSSTGRSPLMAAAEAGQLAMCALLLRRGAELHAKHVVRAPPALEGAVEALDLAP
eukprot:COSAG01_NODE_31056_length_604_cov_1.609901_1_plen_182_part_10